MQYNGIECPLTVELQVVAGLNPGRFQKFFPGRRCLTQSPILVFGLRLIILVYEGIGVYGDEASSRIVITYNTKHVFQVIFSPFLKLTILKGIKNTF